MEKSDFYLKLFWIGLGAVLLGVGAYTLITTFMFWSNINAYYNTYAGQLIEQLHPSQYVQVYNQIYLTLIIGIAEFISGVISTTVAFVLLRRGLSREAEYVGNPQSQGESSRLRLLYERGEISQEAYDSLIKRLQK